MQIDANLFTMLPRDTINALLRCDNNATELDYEGCKQIGDSKKLSLRKCVHLKVQFVFI